MEKFKIVLLLCVFFLSVGAEPIDFKEIIEGKDIEFIKLPYQVRKDKERLSNIYKEFVKDDAIISANHPMVDKTIQSNKSIDFKNLSTQSKFDLYISVGLIDYDKLSKFQLRLKKSQLDNERKNNRIKDQLAAKNFRASIFFMASYGRFSQRNPAHADITFLQNSPASLGFSASYYPKESQYNYSGSIYYSYLTTALIRQTDETVKVDPEIGGNIYFSYKLKSPKLSWYTGIDFEKFNTFNLENLQKNDLVSFDTNQVIYLTLGVSKSVELFSQKFFSKFSYSQSISSQRNNSFAASEVRAPFSGSKILFYLFKNLGNSFFAHSLLKYHWMSGPSDINTLRIGLGFGYIL